MAVGTVKFFLHKQGYGFLTVPGEPDMFFHGGDFFGTARVEDTEVIVFYPRDKDGVSPPGPGETIVYKKSEGKDGKSRAAPWGFMPTEQLAAVLP